MRILVRNELPPELEGLAACCLTYGSRLDYPDSPIPGTGVDFASRTAKHFALHVWRHAPYGDLETHKDLLETSLAGLRPARIQKRVRRSDEDIINLIHRRWERAQGRSSKMLRVLRDEERIACEQGRFKYLFKLAAMQRVYQ